jgi:acyl dehydratase
MSLNEALTGKTYEPSRATVTAEQIERFAQATNDTNPRYRAGPDQLVPPTLPAALALPGFAKVVTDPELGADLGRLIHIRQEHLFHRPVQPGDTISIATSIESVNDRTQQFTIASTQSKESHPVCGVKGTMLIRGAMLPRELVRRARPSGDIAVEEERDTDEDQAVRYAEASGDVNPIHVNDAAAQAAGFSRTILHGACTFAMATSVAVMELAEGDARRVRRVSAVFARPVYPGDRLRFRFWYDNDRDPDRYVFHCERVDGGLVIPSGEIHVDRGFPR